jgi:hypothetical protein
MTLQETIRQVKAEKREDRKQIAHTRLESIAGGGEPLQPHAGVQERTSGHPQRCNGVRDQVPGDGGDAEELRVRQLNGSVQLW